MTIAEVGLIYSVGFGRFYDQYQRYYRSCREGVEEGLELIERRMNVYEQAFSEWVTDNRFRFDFYNVIEYDKTATDSVPTGAFVQGIGLSRSQNNNQTCSIQQIQRCEIEKGDNNRQDIWIVVVM